MEEKEQRLGEVFEKVSKGLKDKAESRLNYETKAVKYKKRDKFDENKDQKRDAMTMGGKLPMLGGFTRAMPQWRQGL